MTVITPDFSKNKMQKLNCCVIIPTYNNEKTIAQVITQALQYTNYLIVVNDGATDNTSEILKSFENKIDLISYQPNKGKGFALRTGLKRAQEKGFRYAITIDSDGQHFAEDIPLFLLKIQQQPDALIVGARKLNQENMPKKNSFGNKFSNFWFKLFTHIDLPDTQSGYRLYPVEKMKGLRFFTTKYEFEMEVLVKAAWKSIKVTSVPIKVYYAEGKERVTHFRPGKDFTRISLLNTYLFFLAFIWYKPILIIKSLTKENIKAFFEKNFLNTNETSFRKSLGVSFGVFMGIIPIWGWQFFSALFLAHYLKLNKVIVGLAAQISVPPMIPFIVYASVKTGQLIMGKDLRHNIFNSNINTVDEIWEAVKVHSVEYLLGSVVFAIVAGILFGLTTFILIKIFGKKRVSHK